MSNKQKYEERLNWFKDRIGKRVFRNSTSCKCDVCTSVEENGIVITDEFHAIYMRDVEGESWMDGEIGIKYFDTKEEVANFVKTL